MTAGYTSDGVRAWKQNAAGARTYYYYYYDGTDAIGEINNTDRLITYVTFGSNGLISRIKGTNSTFYTYDMTGTVATASDGYESMHCKIIKYLFGKTGALTLCIVSALICRPEITHADVRDTQEVLQSYQKLAVLRSYQISSTVTVVGTVTHVCDDWSESPAIRRVVARFMAKKTSVIITPTLFFQQMDIGQNWTKRLASKPERASLVHGRNFNRELSLDKLDFTYSGTTLLGSVQTKIYTFISKTAPSSVRNGKVWIGVTDHLPRRYEEHNSDYNQPVPGSIIETYNNFGVPVIVKLPIVDGKPSMPAEQPDRD